MKRLKNSFIISLIVNIIGLITNYMYYTNNKSLLMAYRSYGGEYMGEFGFGLIVSHIYSMTANGTDSINIRFSILLFLLSLIIIALIAFIFIYIKGNLFRRFYV